MDFAAEQGNVLGSERAFVEGGAREESTYDVRGKDCQEHGDEEVDLLRGLQHDDSKRIGFPGPAGEHGTAAHDLVRIAHKRIAVFAKKGNNVVGNSSDGAANDHRWHEKTSGSLSSGCRCHEDVPGCCEDKVFSNRLINVSIDQCTNYTTFCVEEECCLRIISAMWARKRKIFSIVRKNWLTVFRIIVVSSHCREPKECRRCCNREEADF